jgi:hypothetical protein
MHGTTVEQTGNVDFLSNPAILGANPSWFPAKILCGKGKFFQNRCRRIGKLIARILHNQSSSLQDLS